MARNAKALIFAGVVLIAVSLGGLLAWQILEKNTEENTAAILAQLDNILLPRSEGLPEDYRVMQMPVLQVDGQDIVGILEIPDFGIRLPVCAGWDQGSAWGIPRRFSGSVDDGSLVIGGSDQPGQFACFDRIANGTQITIVDMTGAVFSYTVTQVQRSDSVPAEFLTDGSGALTLFMRDIHTMDYIILRCDL